MSENAIIIDYLNNILKETIKLSNEIARIRGKMESELYKIGNKYDMVYNSIMVCKNKYKNSIRCYTQKLKKGMPLEINFD